MKAASAKAKGSRLEREVAARLGGKRMVLSGAVGGGDVAVPAGSIWNDWVWECKNRNGALPEWVTKALLQAELECAGTRRRPAAVLRNPRSRPVVCFYFDDLVAWVEALAEVGNGQALKSAIRQVKRQLDEVEGMI